MNFKKSNYLLAFLILLLCFSHGANAQTPSRCFEIESILVDACGSPEGENEMVRFQVGPTSLNSNNLSITWPNNPWLHFCTAPLKIDSFNRTIVSCGYILAPPNGIIPAGKQVIIVTSTDVNVAFNSFANLSDTIYMLFQCAGNTAGHFVNYNATPGIRTLIITDTTTLCGDTVSYDRSLLVNINGGHGGGTALENGGSVSYAFNNTATYFNNGCNAPFIVPSVNAGSDSTYHFCTSAPVISLHGAILGSIKSVHWTGGLGTFSHSDSLTTTYTPSLFDVSPIQFILTAQLTCPDSIKDTVNAVIIPPVGSVQSVTICYGSSYHIGAHFYSNTGVYLDTLLTIGGCDSIVLTTLSVITPASQTLNLSGCSKVLYKGVSYTSNTSFADTLRGTTGCDSIHYTINIQISYPTTYAQNIALCQGQSLTIGAHIHAIAGTYTDTITNAAGCDSIITTVLTYTGNPLNAGNNVSICIGDSAQLQATGGLTYSWSPTAGLSNPNIANPIAHPTTTTTYTVVSSVSSANQIVNGDFSSGNTGFSSSYTYSSPTNTVEGQYIVSTNAQSWNGGMAPCGDHTTGTGNMLIVNGAVTANVSIYCQTVNVVPNTNYAFSTWLQSVTATNPAQLQFSINGSLIGPVFTAASANCAWQQFYTTWNSGANTSATICIVNQNTIASGNDFAIDDISFAPLCTGVDSVKVTVLQPYSGSVSKSICQGSSYVYNGHTYSSTGTYIDTVSSPTICDSIITTYLTVIQPTSQTINLTACGQLIYKGVTHTSNITVLDTLRGSLGCDSVNLTVNITVKQNTTFSQTVSVCQGQSITVGTHSHSTPGTYIDTLTNAIGCDSIVTTTLSYAGTPISAGNNTSICQGYSTQLQATGGSTYTWTPSTGLSDSTIANPIANPTTTTTYTVSTLVPVGNQITNGDFSSGNSGFSSGYTYTNVPPGAPCGTYGILGCEGYYDVDVNPANTHSNFASFGDHTTGTGEMMIVNGSTSPSVNVWCQNINVTPNTTYQFSAWVANVDNGPSSLPNLQFTINGVALGSYFSPSINGGVWSQFAVSWFSGSNTSINICLTDSSTVSGGNDFAIDDISFSHVCNATDTVQVVVQPSSYYVQSPVICPGQTITIGQHSYGSNGTYQDTLRGIASSGCDSIVTTHLTILTATTTNKNVCINTGQSYLAGGHLQTTSGVYSDTLFSSKGCDSIITLTNLNVITPIRLTQHIDSCSRVTVNGTVYTSTTIISDTIHSPLGCDSIITTDSIIVYQPVNISISSSQTLPLVEGDSTLLTITPAGTYQNVVWTPDSNIGNINAPYTQVWPQRDTTYHVAATDSNSCPVSGSIEITVKPNGKADFVMPTAFSPNGDGRNDLYRPILRPGAEVLMFHIYNRWGELVYDKDRDNSQGWDGSYKNTGQPTEVYVYYISVRGVAGNIIKQQGNLTLLR